ncbi:hypothetical protein HPB47_020523 [Ixodes persulcatus]|uniref:Uncharacterized protein n=1 Tax=Ixodes persulcatus TaxID=34615 RepID=A0AC60QF51_IXOPE|nr:hypothetical protein HPB47_020523 [Ixodes persulcatus]
MRIRSLRDSDPEYRAANIEVKCHRRIEDAELRAREDEVRREQPQDNPEMRAREAEAKRLRERAEAERRARERLSQHTYEDRPEDQAAVTHAEHLTSFNNNGRPKAQPPVLRYHAYPMSDVLNLKPRPSLLGAKTSVLAMPKHLPCQRLDHLTPPGLEAILVEVFCKHGKLLLVSTYCPPSLPEQSYALLQESLQRVDPSRFSALFI